MSAPTVSRRPAGPASVHGEMTPQRLARITGALYVVLAVLGMLGPLTLESLLVPGDVAATSANIAGAQLLFTASLIAWVVIVVVDVAVSVTLFLLLAPVARGHALVAAGFRLVYSAVLGALLVHLFVGHRLLTSTGGTADTSRQGLASLEAFSDGFLVALVFFGAHLLLLGPLLYRSRYVPRVFGVLLVAAGFGYIVDSLGNLLLEGYGGAVSAVLLTPAVLGEIGLAFWLLIKGVDLQ